MLKYAVPEQNFLIHIEGENAVIILPLEWVSLQVSVGERMKLKFVWTKVKFVHKVITSTVGVKAKK